MPRPHPAALPHGDITPVFDDIFQVTGGLKFKRGPFTIEGRRNMTILRQGNELTLVNTVRLGDAGLAQLDSLGMVKHVIRVGSFHGMDDPFYKERYGAHIWSVNAPYNASLSADPGPEDVYFEADTWLEPGSSLPIADAEFIEISSSTPKESVLLLHRQGGIVLPADCFQNIDPTDKPPTLISGFFARLGGFRRAYNIGPGWYRIAKPDIDEVAAIVDRGFAHVLPSHGKPGIGDAANRYRVRVEELQRERDKPGR
jgi:hypothetical protein